MRTCETCRYQHHCDAAGVYCFKWQGWELKVEAQLAAKDKIIEGLVELCEEAIVADEASLGEIRKRLDVAIATVKEE